MPRDKKKQQRKELMSAVSYLSVIAIRIVVCIGLGVLLGRFIDNLLNTSPWLVLVFSLLGAGAAFKSIFDIAMKDNKE